MCSPLHQLVLTLGLYPRLVHKKKKRFHTCCYSRQAKVRYFFLCWSDFCRSQILRYQVKKIIFYATATCTVVFIDLVSLKFEQRKKKGKMSQHDGSSGLVCEHKLVMVRPFQNACLPYFLGSTDPDERRGQAEIIALTSLTELKTLCYCFLR